MKTNLGYRFFQFSLAGMLFMACNLDNLHDLEETQPCGIVAQFTSDKDNCLAPCTIRFTNVSEGSMAYEWDFGDGNSTNTANATHTFEKPGEYIVQLNAQGENCRTSLERPITVEVNTFQRLLASNFRAVRTIKQANDGGYILAGNTDNNTYFISKLDAFGNEEWQDPRAGNYNNSIINSIIQNSDGSFSAVGETRTFAGDMDLLYVNIGLGSPTYKAIGGSTNNSGRDIIETKDGDLVTVGNDDGDLSIMKFNMNGDIIWQKKIGGSESDKGESVIQTNSGDFMVVGQTISSVGSGASNIYVVKVANNGKMIWEKKYSGIGRINDGYDVLQLSSGEYAILGTTDVDTWDAIQVIIIDGNGREIKSRNLPNEVGELELGFEIKETSSNDLIIGGYTTEIGTGQNDFYLVKINTDLDIIWENTFGGIEPDLGLTVATTCDGGFIMGGTMSNSNVFRAAIVKTDSEGNVK